MSARRGGYIVKNKSQRKAGRVTQHLGHTLFSGAQIEEVLCGLCKDLAGADSHLVADLKESPRSKMDTPLVGYIQNKKEAAV